MSTLFVNTITPNSGDTVTVSGSLLTTGKLTIGDASTDTVSFEAEISSSLIPDAHNAYTLGSSVKSWQSLHSISVSSNQVNTVQIGSPSNSANFAYFDVASAAMLAGKGVVSGGTISMSAHLHPLTTATVDLGTMDKAFRNLHAHGLGHIGTASINQVTSSLIPVVDDQVDLGSSAKQWKDLYVDGTANIDSASIDVLRVNSSVTSSLIPSVDDQVNLGSSTKQWKDLYVDGTAYIDNLGVETISASSLPTSEASATSGQLFTLSGSQIPLSGSTAELNAFSASLFVFLKP